MHATLQFRLGQTLITPGAMELFETLELTPLAYLQRHQGGDWGDLDPLDAESNQAALLHGSRIFSAYQVTAHQKIWIITEADRSATTILLPSEY